MKQILLIFSVVLSLQIFCQDCDSIIFSLNGKIVSDEESFIAKYPNITILFDKDNQYRVFGDSLGYFSFVEKIRTDLNEAYLIIGGIENYTHKILKLLFDTLDNNVVYEYKLILIISVLIPGCFQILFLRKILQTFYI